MAKKKSAKKKPVKKAKKARKAAPKRKAAKRPARKAAAKKAAPKKAAARKKAKPQAPAGPAPLPWRVPLEGESKLGVVQDYYGHIGVIALTLEGSLKVGDKIHVRGHTTDLVQAVDSIQIGHESVPQANPGDGIGVKVSDKCRNGDFVYLCAC